MRSKIAPGLFALLLALLGNSPTRAADAPPVNYSRDIKPILEDAKRQYQEYLRNARGRRSA